MLLNEWVDKFQKPKAKLERLIFLNLLISMPIIFDSHLVILPKGEKKKQQHYFLQIVHSLEDLITLENRFLKCVILNDWS